MNAVTLPLCESKASSRPHLTLLNLALRNANIRDAVLRGKLRPTELQLRTKGRSQVQPANKKNDEQQNLVHKSLEMLYLRKANTGENLTTRKTTPTEQNMDRYIGQKAQQALEALTTEDSLQQRLAAARSHLGAITSEHFFQSAPSEVQKCLTAICDISDTDSRPSAARKICDAIESIFEACGCQEAELKEAKQIVYEHRDSDFARRNVPVEPTSAILPTSDL